MEKQNPTKKKSKKSALWIALMLIVLVSLFLAQCALKNIKESNIQVTNETKDTTAIDTVKTIEEVPDTLITDTLVADTPVQDTVFTKKVFDPMADSLRRLKKARADSIKAYEKMRADSIKHALDSLKALDSLRRIDSLKILDSLSHLDTVPPTVSLVPPPGRYYDPIKLKAKCDEIKCTGFVSFGDTLNPQETKKGIEYNKTGVVFFRAKDSAGNFSAWETGEYDMASDNRCGKNAYPVPIKGKDVCVDAYEYPNKADETPKDMVSKDEAESLCNAQGKRLCTLEEWQAACKGKDYFKYSYGEQYISTRCNANTKAALRAGRKTQCRSWWGMYDMNGNLWEWTSTPKDGKFYVAGGSWSGNNQSRCTEASYSFYPQNQYPSVGFRCCAD